MDAFRVLSVKEKANKTNLYSRDQFTLLVWPVLGGMAKAEISSVRECELYDE